MSVLPLILRRVTEAVASYKSLSAGAIYGSRTRSILFVVLNTRFELIFFPIVSPYIV